MSSILLGAPAIPLDTAGRYVAAAYAVFVVLLVIYVAIMAVRLSNLSKEIESLAELAERNNRARTGEPEPLAEADEAAAAERRSSEEARA